MKHTLPGQLEMPTLTQRLDALARINAAKPLKPQPEQKALDFGLFSDDSLQTDLVEMVRQHVNR